MNWQDEIDKRHKGQTGFFKEIEQTKTIIMKTSRLPKDTKEYVIETIEFTVEYYKELLTQFGDEKTVFQKTKAQYKDSIKEFESLLLLIGSDE
jgi:hypothetical protein